MSRLSRKPHTLMMTVTLAAAALAYVMFIFLPRQRAIGQKRHTLLQQQQFITQADRLGTAIQKSVHDVEAARQFTVQWRANSPSEDQLAALFAKMTRLAEEAGARLTKLEPHEVVQGETIWHLSLTIQCTGDFRQIFDWIGRLEALPATVWLTDVHLELANAFGARRARQDADRNGPGRDDAAQNGEKLSAEITLMIFADKPATSD